MATWIDIVQSAGRVAAELELNGGEDPDGLLDQLIKDCDQKIEGYFAVIDGIQSRVDLLKKEERRIKDRRQALQAKIEKLKFNCLQILKAHPDLDNNRINTGRVTALISVSESVRIADNANLDPEYLREQTQTTIDKIAITAAIKAGKTIDGAQLVQNESIRFTNGAQ
tara:strand:+ start:469 stop:972 length:504 start_codon:yes stop_codon:yes gene_type:complete